MTIRTALVAALVWGAWGGPASGQTTDPPWAAEVARLRAEIEQLHGQVASLRAEITRLAAPAVAIGGASHANGGAPQEVESQPASPELGATVAVLQSQIAEQAQVKVESTSRLPVKIFGTIHASTFVNSGEANWLENPNIVQPTPPGERSGTFSSTLRQSRFGLTVDGLHVGPLRASGLLAFDFLGGVPAFQTGTVMGIPRLVYGFARLETDTTSIEIGQDEMVLAPRDPTSLAAFGFPDLFRSGNLYLRVPQIRLGHRTATGHRGTLELTGAIVAPVAGDFTTPLYTFAPAAGAGERSRAPAFQARVGWRAESDAGEPLVEAGVSGHYGRSRAGGDTDESWAGALDFNLGLGRFGAGGEFFTGDRLGAFGGSLGQQVRATGGFVEGRVAAMERLQLVGGFGLDRVAAADRPSVPLERNETGFGNAIYRFTPELAGSVEYRWLRTSTSAGARRENQHVNLTLAFDF